MIFQDPYGSLNARLSVAAIIREPLDIHRVGDLRASRLRVGKLIDMVGLPATRARHPHEFSAANVSGSGSLKPLLWPRPLSSATNRSRRSTSASRRRSYSCLRTCRETSGSRTCSSRTT